MCFGAHLALTLFTLGGHLIIARRSLVWVHMRHNSCLVCAAHAPPPIHASPSLSFSRGMGVSQAYPIPPPPCKLFSSFAVCALPHTLVPGPLNLCWLKGVQLLWRPPGDNPALAF